ncbi:MAG: DUF2892 domain-containing protein [Deltaproteobacteria bacterium]|nr:DUF2892 domain-containing protein [Deltaproteobacteria bacterium]
MHIERWLRLIGGIAVLGSVILGFTHSHYWFYFTGFVGLNLLQSAFTNFCPMMVVLRKIGIRECK